jgi:predicted permease
MRAFGAFPDAFSCRRIAATARTVRESVAFGGDGVIADIRFAARMIHRSPVFTAGAVASLSIGIAGTTTAFGALNAMLFRSLPGVEESTRVAHVYTKASWLAGSSSPVEYFRHYREVLTSFSDLATFGDTTVAIGAADEPFVATAILVSDNYFGLLGTKPAAGRFIDRAVARDRVAVVSHDFAVRQFGGAGAAVGRTVVINGQTLDIIGIAPPWFAGVRPGGFGDDAALRPQVWIPLDLRDALLPEPAPLMNRSQKLVEWVEIVGRLAPGVTLANARAQAASQPSRPIGGLRGDAKPLVMPLGHGPEDSAADVATVVVLILSVPMIVLAIGCANTANLQLARAAHRQAEIAVRRSLGATRGRVVRQLLIESIVIAGIAGVLAVLCTMVLTSLLASFMPVPFPVDWRVLGFALAVVVVTGLGFGMSPALNATRGDLTTPLKDSSGAPSYTRSRLRSGLVVAQIALSLLLLVMAGLFTRTVQRMHGLDSGRDMAHVAAATIDLGLLKYSETQGRAFQQELLARLERLPGVVAGAVVPFEPFGGTPGLTYRRPDDTTTKVPFSYTNGGAPLGRFIETAGIRVVRGRGFTDLDRIGPPKVALVSETLARRISPTGNVVGQELLVADGDTPKIPVTIVGVTADAFLRVDVREMHAMFLPSPISYDPTVSLWVRTTGDPSDLLPAIRTIVRELDPRLPIPRIGTAESWRYREIGPFRWIASGLGAMGGLALLLAAAGLYAVMTYLVANRRHEMAVRLALGASSRHLVGLIVGYALWLCIPGLAVGVLLSALVARIARFMLMGVSPLDPVAFLTVGTVLAGVAFLATLFPALRASRLDPLATLRRF